MNIRWRTAWGASLGTLILILDAPGALRAARDGVTLCLQTLIPSLFPFFLCSIVLTDALLGQSIPLLRGLERFCRIPEGSGGLLLVGFLGGYPVGAQNVSMAHARGEISREDAVRMLGFVNNAGPAFLFGMVSQFFDSPRCPWLLWGIHIAGALAAARCLPGKPGQFRPQKNTASLSLPQAMEKAITVMGSVCGWVVLFRMAADFLEKWFLWRFPVPLQVAIKGLLELSNGCVCLGQIEPEGLRFILASVLLSCGGLCVAMQTRSVCPDLPIRQYATGKLIQTIVSFTLASLVQMTFTAGHPFAWTAALWIPALVLLLFLFRKNKGSIPATAGV